MPGMIDVGSGPPVVLIPGIQGRWEWMWPAVDALERHCRVLSISLAGDPGSGCGLDPARGFDNYVDQIETVMSRAGLADRGLWRVVRRAGRAPLGGPAAGAHAVPGSGLDAIPGLVARLPDQLVSPRASAALATLCPAVAVQAHTGNLARARHDERQIDILRPAPRAGGPIALLAASDGGTRADDVDGRLRGRLPPGDRPHARRHW